MNPELGDHTPSDAHNNCQTTATVTSAQRLCLQQPWMARMVDGSCPWCVTTAASISSLRINADLLDNVCKGPHLDGGNLWHTHTDASWEKWEELSRVGVWAVPSWDAAVCQSHGWLSDRRDPPGTTWDVACVLSDLDCNNGQNVLTYCSPSSPTEMKKASPG